MRRCSSSRLVELVGVLGAEQLETACDHSSRLASRHDPTCACAPTLPNKGTLTACHARKLALASPSKHHVVVPEQPPHQYYVTVHQSAPTATLRRERRRHGRRFTHFPSPPRVLHRKRSPISAMATTRPTSAAAAAGAAICVLGRATARPGCANGTWRGTE